MSSGNTHPIPGMGWFGSGLTGSRMSAYLNVGLIERQPLAANRGSA